MIPITRAGWSAKGLPPGVRINAQTGVLSGTPASNGEYSSEISVETNWGTAKKTLSIQVFSNKSKYEIWVDDNFYDEVSIPDLVQMVRDGTAQEEFNTTNTQLILPFVSPDTGREYECPMNFCSFRDVTLEDGTTKPGLILQTLYALPANSSPQFDNDETGNPNGTRASYGNNRWAYSNIRQWMQATGKDWFKKAHDYDAPPTGSNFGAAYDSYTGLLDCFPSNFIDGLTPVKVDTQTISADGGEVDTTYDTFFLPSMEEVYATSQYSSRVAAAGVEGTAWEYWVAKIGTSSPQKNGGDDDNLNRAQYRLGADEWADPSSVWLRSAVLNSQCAVWRVEYGFWISTQDAHYGCQISPACVIC